MLLILSLISNSKQQKNLADIQLYITMSPMSVHGHEDDEGEDPDKNMVRDEIAEYGVPDSISTPVDHFQINREPVNYEDFDPTIRTQIYLSKKHHDFLKNKSKEEGLSMAAIIRELIDEKMNPENTAWEGNPLLEETAIDTDFQSSGQGSVSSDASIYGSYEG